MPPKLVHAPPSLRPESPSPCQSLVSSQRGASFATGTMGSALPAAPVPLLERWHRGADQHLRVGAHCVTSTL